jgi:protein-tyrosine phosphatase
MKVFLVFGFLFLFLIISPAARAAGRLVGVSNDGTDNPLGLINVTDVQSTLVRFARIHDGVYRGSQPKNDHDMAILKSFGVRYLLSLQILPWDKKEDVKWAAKYHVTSISVPLKADFLPPSEEGVNRALAYMRAAMDPAGEYHGLYVHCMLGRDRTSLVVAMNRIFNDGWSPADAQDEMLKFGISQIAILHGLPEYFEDHKNGPNPFGGPVSENILRQIR